MSTASPIIGIIGGFGPDTSATFCVNLVKHAHALKPSHPPAFVVDFVSVSPKLSGQAINGSVEAGMSLATQVGVSIARLHSLGVKTVALPCNTLHLFANDFALPTSVRLLHIVDAVVEELRSHSMTRIGLLATQLTVSSGLYADRCAVAGIECVTPSAQLQQRLNESIGHFVATGAVLPETHDVFRESFNEFLSNDVQAVVLGCTDISGMIKLCDIEHSLQCIDSMDVLAKACARICV